MAWLLEPTRSPSVGPGSGGGLLRSLPRTGRPPLVLEEVKMDSDFPSILEIIKGLGIAGGPVFGVLWWLERTERRTCQDDYRTKLLELYATSTATVQATKQALEDRLPLQRRR